MKKYLFGILAIAMVAAILVVSVPSNAEREQSVETSYTHWYELSGNFVIDEIDQNKTRTQMLNTSLPCPPGEVAACVIGSNVEIDLHTEIDPGDFTGDAVIKKAGQ